MHTPPVLEYLCLITHIWRDLVNIDSKALLLLSKSSADKSFLFRLCALFLCTCGQSYHWLVFQMPQKL